MVQLFCKRRGVRLFACVLGVVGLSFLVPGPSRAEKPSGAGMDIEKIMEKAFKGKDRALIKRAIKGTASKDELQSLLGYVKALAAAKPPKGELSSWQDKTGALVKATESLLKGEQGASQSLEEASACKACHNVHKAD